MHPTSLSTQSQWGNKSGWNGYLQPTMWEHTGLPLEKITCWHVCPSSFKIFIFLEGGYIFQECPNSCDIRFRVAYRMRVTWKWSNNIIHAGGKHLVISLLSLPYQTCYVNPIVNWFLHVECILELVIRIDSITTYNRFFRPMLHVTIEFIHVDDKSSLATKICEGDNPRP